MLKRLLQNKRGEMYIRACIYVMILCLVFVLMFNYILTIIVAKEQRQSAEQILDQYTQLNSIEIHNSIKMQHDKTESLDPDAYVAALCQFQNLTDNGSGYASENAEGGTRYIVSDVTLAFQIDLTTKIYASYTLSVPLNVFGTAVWIDIPVKIASGLDAKFDVPATEP